MYTFSAFCTFWLFLHFVNIVQYIKFWFCRRTEWTRELIFISYLVLNQRERVSSHSDFLMYLSYHYVFFFSVNTLQIFFQNCASSLSLSLHFRRLLVTNNDFIISGMKYFPKFSQKLLKLKHNGLFGRYVVLALSFQFWCETNKNQWLGCFF